MWIEKENPCESVNGTVVRMRPVNPGEAAVPADRKAAGAKHQNQERAKQQNADEDCEDHSLSG